MAAFCGFAVFSCFATLRYAFFRVTGFTAMRPIIIILII
jgi:hypothetical protein